MKDIKVTFMVTDRTTKEALNRLLKSLQNAGDFNQEYVSVIAFDVE